MPPRAQNIYLANAYLERDGGRERLLVGATIDERVCADLGEACAAWRADAKLRATYLPPDGQLTMRKSDSFRCETYVADENYATHTLPDIRYPPRSARQGQRNLPHQGAQL